MVENRGYHTSSIRTAVTVNLSVTAGSAVALKPDITQLWAPRQTMNPAGRLVARMRAAASWTAAWMDGTTCTSYLP